jgi:protein-disulfide isomerase
MKKGLRVRDERTATLRRFWRAALGIGVGLFTVACIITPPAKGVAPAGGAAQSPSAGGVAFIAATGQATSVEIPVDLHDAAWGNAQAPCTVVMFQDLQCPFCRRSWEAMGEIEKQYGPERLRFVYKHFPLPFHDEAMPSARVAQAVFELRGPAAFRDFITKAFGARGDLSDDRLREMALSEGVTAGALDEMLVNQKSVAWKKLDDDAVLARLLSVQGTPHFFINGARVVGAQPIEEFRRVIDAELAAADKLRSSGALPQDVYGVRVKANLALEPEEERVAGGSANGDSDDIDAKVYRVPVDHQPVEGSPGALVTIVEFIDYECPFCRKAEATREQLLKKYPGQLRFAIRHSPLPFHSRALPVARLAIEAFKEKGNVGFWAMHRRLLATDQLDDSSLLALAQAEKLDPKRAKRAIESTIYQEVLDEDGALATDVRASGTPHFFINGVRLSGAQPLQEFERVIDTQLAKARAIVQAGTAPGSVYASVMKQAVNSDPFEHKSIPAPTGKNPQQGLAAAPVVIDVFMDFQCPYCSRIPPILQELNKSFPGKLRIVYRSRPLPFHNRARAAAEAALEAFKQAGNPGFWKMFDKLFAVQSVYGAFELSELEHYASEQGLDVNRFRRALNDHEHESEIAADESIADKADISGTPACVINGIYVSGAQPVGSFKQAVRAALVKR